MPIDLTALLSKARVEVRINSPKAAIRARLDQRDAATLAAEQYAKSLEKRHSVQRALASADMDAFRFRWLAANPGYYLRLPLGGIDTIRRDIDLWIKQETIRKLNEMRSKQA